MSNIHRSRRLRLPYQRGVVQLKLKRRMQMEGVYGRKRVRLRTYYY